MAEWCDVHVGFEGDDLRIGGVEIWKQDWRDIDQKPIELPHPSYRHQRHQFHVYEVGDVENPVRFAAGELSPLVWGFYIPIK
jgi:hypothetical protein